MTENNSNSSSLIPIQNKTLVRVVKALAVIEKIFAKSSNPQVVKNNKSVIIGNLEWMVENLNVSKFRNDDTIPEAKTAEDWYKAGKESKPVWCFYDNDPINGEKYGKLYNWYAVNDPRGLAPKSWHIPSDIEWYELEYYLDESNLATKIKSQNGWKDLWKGNQKFNGNGNNDSGFSALPGGNRHGGEFFGIGKVCYWWSSSEVLSHGICRGISHSGRYDGKFSQDKMNGLSIRCIRRLINNYKSVIINNQEWMVENLNLINFKNGDPIPEAKTNEEWAKLGAEGKPAWCNYHNDQKNGIKFGKLYNWFAINDPRGLAPKGWHVSSDREWSELIYYLGPDAKTKMMSINYWNEDSLSNISTNESGFSALPGGGRYTNIIFDFLGANGIWWCSNEDGKQRALCRNIYYVGKDIRRESIIKSFGFSVRCLRD